MKRYSAALVFLAGFGLCALTLTAQDSSHRLVLDRKGETIVLEPYAPNILRVTLSLNPDPAKAAPGYGFVASPNILRVTLSLNPDPAKAAPGYGFVASPESAGWAASRTDDADVYKSDRIVATVESNNPRRKYAVVQSEVDISKFFNGSAPGAHITFTTPEGKKLLEMTGWSQAVPNRKDGTAGLALDFRPTDPKSYIVGATFVSPDDEHYYGLGQNHEGFLDHRGHPVRCWNDYTAPAAPSTCVPFLVTNKGYGLIWDNPSKTTIEPGFNEQTRWTSEVGDRVSFFVIAGKTADEKE
jgi:alpha-D-xyloside xylohydrolase